MTRNAPQRDTSARDWLRSPDVLAGFREALRGLPPDFAARPTARAACHYELGRQLAIYLRAEGLTGKRPTPPCPRNLKRMAADTGLPKIRGLNA